MKKFWKIVSKKDVIFLLCIFALVIVITFFDFANKIKVNFDDEAVNIKTSKYSMRVEYTLVDSIELTDIPEAGSSIDGADDMVVRTGVWTNGAWGEYTACMVLTHGKCIVIHLNDGRIFAFNSTSASKTAEVYQTFLSHLPDAT